MIIKRYSAFLVLVVILIITTVSCKDKKEDEITPEDSYDRSGMLANIGDNIIVPSYLNLKLSVDSLQSYTAQFTSNPTLVALGNLQTQFALSYTAYQFCSAFEFGPAENQYIRSNFNTFPCDTLQINTKISIAEYTLSSAADLDAKGFPGIDYLLYGRNMDNNLALARFTSAVDANNAKTFLTALVNELKSKTDIVYNGWSAMGGNYISSFKSNTGNDIGGSIGMLVNQLNYDLELLKNAKIGIPLGKKTLGVPQPSKVESLYATQSLQLALQNLISIENIYLGRNAAGADGLGFDDYLAHLGVMYGSVSLNEAIKNKMISAKNKLSLIPPTLSDAVVTNTAIVDAAYMELQQLVILLKVDMPSSLGVSITYVDADGD